MRKSQWTAIVVLLAVLVLPLSSHAQKWGKVTQAEWDMIAPADYPEANAVILFDKGVVEITLDGIALERHVRIKILNQAGVEDAGDVSFSYRDGDKIKGLKAHCITLDGKKHKVKKGGFLTKTSGSRKAMTFSFPAVDSGVVLEYRYRNINKRFSLLDSWYFQSELYTMRSEYRLDIDEGFTYSTVSNRLPQSAQVSEQSFDRVSRITSYTWTVENLLPIKSEPYMGALQDYTVSLHNQLVSFKNDFNNVIFIRDWSDLGKTFTEEFLAPYVEKSDKLKDLVGRLVTGAVGQEARSRLIYRFVCDSIKAKTDEERHWLTHESILDIVEKRYGTPIEKNILLVEMTKLAGMEAWPVLISTRFNGRFNPKIYQVQQFDDVLSYVETDSGGVFLDATSKYCPYGLLPPSCLTTGGFLLDGENSEIVRLVTREPRSYRLDNTVVTVDQEGIAHCSTTSHLTGYLAIKYGRRYETHEPDDFVEEFFLDRLGSEHELVSHTFNQNLDAQRCELMMLYTASELTEFLDNNLAVVIPVLSFGKNPFKDKRRICPIDFQYPFTYHNIVTIRAEDSSAVTQLPENISIEIHGASFVLNCSVNGSNAVIESRLTIEKPLFELSEYLHLRELFADMENASADQAILGLGE